MGSLIKKPSAWIPIAMSFTALAILLGYLAIYGNQQTIVNGRPDEGTAAHLFQILMGGQVPIIAFFAIKCLPRAPRESLEVLALQFLAGFFPFALLYYFEH